MGYFEVLFVIQAAIIIAFIVSLIVKPRLVKARVSKALYWISLIFLGSMIIVSTSIPLVYKFTGMDFGTTGPTGIGSTGIIVFGEVPFNVYTDVAATVLCTSINWGNISTGRYYNRTLYMKNEGSSAMDAQLTQSNFNPVAIAPYFWIRWDYGSNPLKPSMTRKILLQIYVWNKANGETGGTPFNTTFPTQPVNFSFNFMMSSSIASVQPTVTPTPTPTPAANLLANPSVESGVSTTPDSWAPTKTSHMIATLSWVSDSHTGAKAVRIDATFNSTGGSSESALWRQTLTVTVGAMYRFRCLYKSNVMATLILLASGASYNVQLSLSASTSYAQSGWLQITVPAGTTSLLVDARIFNSATGWAVFDDFELEKIS